MATTESTTEVTTTDTLMERRVSGVETQKSEQYKTRLLFPDLASSNPKNSRVWYWVKHPYTRFAVAISVTIINFYICKDSS